MYDRILIPTDGSNGADRGIDEGLELARASGATVHLLFVVDEDLVGHTPALGIEELSIERVEEHAREMLDGLVARAEELGVETETQILRGDPSTSIVDYVDDHDIDLVVMGRHGIRDYEEPHIGSVTDRVLRTSPSPVMPV